MDWLHPVVQVGHMNFIYTWSWIYSQPAKWHVYTHRHWTVSTETAPTTILVIFFQNKNMFYKYAKHLVIFADICTQLTVPFSLVHKINSVEHVFGDSAMYSRTCHRGSCVRSFATKHTHIISSQNFVHVADTALTCLIFFLHKNYIPNACTLTVNVFCETILISQAH